MKERLPRRTFLQRAALASLGAGVVMGSAPRARGAADCPTAAETFGLRKRGKKIPVIFDTDIGGDIDDTWALTMMLKSPELDVRLVVSDSGNDIYRARILAKMLDVFHRTDVPVGVGLGKTDKPGRQSEWVGDYTLSRYPGKAHEDGVDAIIQTIHSSPEPISLVCVGPVPNIAEALRRDPSICRNARFIGMHGSIRVGYGGASKPSAEANVRGNPKALQAVFAAPWEITITPLDTCGLVNLAGQRYQKVYRCSDPGVQALVANYLAWSKARDPAKKGAAVKTRSSTLFDTVAVYLSYSERLTPIELLPLRVTDDGMTVIDKESRLVRCATRWTSLDAYRDHLADRLVAPR